MRTILLFMLGVSLYAQVDTSIIGGTIRDVNQVVVPGASVVIANLATSFAVKTETDEKGLYVSPPLRPGNYQILVEKEGFQKTAAEAVLQLSRRTTADLTLAIASVETSVTVTETVTELAKESSSIGTVRAEQEIRELPVNQRNVVRIIELTPGTVPMNTQAQTTGVSNYRGTALSSVNGQQQQNTNYLVDGINNLDNHGGAAVVIYPPIEAVAEMKIQNAGADAQFGRSGGGIINVILKSGSQQFHGSVFEYLRNSAMDAKNYFAPPGNQPRFGMHQFGGSFSGPIFIPGIYNTSKSKTFFFMDYDALRRSQALNIVSTLPQPDYVRGDFSRATQRIYDPLSTCPNSANPGGPSIRCQFPGNVIPTDRIDPVGRNFANLYPAPNRPGLTNNYIYTPARIFDMDYGDVKVDHYFSQNDWLTVRWSQGNLRGFEPSALPAPAVGAGPSFPGDQGQPHLQGQISYTRTISPTAFNEVRIGVSRLSQLSTQLTVGQTLAQQLGVPGVNVPGDPNTTGNVSVLSVTGYQPLGDASYTPGAVITDNNQLSDNFSWIRGSHSIKFGGEVMRRRYNIFQSVNPRGTIAFNPIYTTNTASPTGTGDGLAELLLGCPQTMGIEIANGTRGLRRWEWSGYIQDTWKISPKLTLNYGLRYEVYESNPWTEVSNRQAQFLLDKGAVFPVGSPEVPSASGTNTDRNNFAPRLGIAYTATSRTVIRASYGLYYAPIFWTLSSSLAFNPPYVGRVAYNNDAANFAGARMLSQGFDRPTAFSPIGSSLNSVQTNLTTPYVQQWNFGIQQELPSRVLMSIDYIGSKSTHLQSVRDINMPVPGPATVPSASRRPYPQYADIRLLSTDAVHNYNSLQVMVERRFAQGFGFQSAYTWSHCINTPNGLAATDWQNPNDRRSERGNCEFDLRHRWVTTASYFLPFGRGQKFASNVSPLANALIGGWQINGIVNLFSGLPFTVTSAVNTTNSPGSIQRVDLVPGCNPVLSSDERSPERWFNTSCFVAPQQGTWGNVGRNTLFGPPTAMLDTSMFKDFHVSKNDRVRVQLRGEIFNVTNTPQFNNPASAIGPATAGRISSAGSIVTFARTQRQIQTVLRVTF